MVQDLPFVKQAVRQGGEVKVVRLLEHFRASVI
jgi:hypothetical protein